MRIKNSLNTYHTTRKKVYFAAQNNCAKVPSGNHLADIKYDNDGDLLVSLMFHNQRDANSFDCQIVSGFWDGADDSVHSVITDCFIPASALYVMRCWYDGAQSGSPDGSSVSSAMISDVVTSDDLHQRLERVCMVTMVVPDGCHLIDAAKCASVGICSKADKSNLLFLSPLLHRMLDGTTGENGSLPLLTVEPNGIVENDTLVDLKGKSRTRVNVRIVFRSREVAVALSQSIMFRKETVKVNDYTFDSFVHVRNPSVFVQGAAWKAAQTKALFPE